MPIEVSIDESDGLMWVTVEHPFSESDVRQLTGDLISRGFMDTIVDLTPLTEPTLDTDWIRQLARYLPVNPNIVAIIATNSGIFARARLYETVSELKEGSGPRAVFRSREEALAWVKEERMRRGEPVEPEAE